MADAQWTSGRSQSLHPRCFKAKNIQPIFSNRFLGHLEWAGIDWLIREKGTSFLIRVDHFYKGTKCLWMAYRSPLRLRICNLPCKEYGKTLVRLMPGYFAASLQTSNDLDVYVGKFPQGSWVTKAGSVIQRHLRETSNCKKGRFARYGCSALWLWHRYLSIFSGGPWRYVWVLLNLLNAALHAEYVSNNHNVYTI